MTVFFTAFSMLVTASFTALGVMSNFASASNEIVGPTDTSILPAMHTSSINPSGRSVCALVVLLPGINPFATCSASVGVAGFAGMAISARTVVFAFAASACTTL